MAARIDVSIEHKHAPPETNADGKPHPNTCPSCGSHYRDDELAEHLNVCPQCGHHFPMRARARIGHLSDKGTFIEEAADLRDRVGDRDPHCNQRRERDTQDERAGEYDDSGQHRDEDRAGGNARLPGERIIVAGDAGLRVSLDTIEFLIKNEVDDAGQIDATVVDRRYS